MSVFEVRDTSTQGYIAKESATGLKTGVPLMDLPMAVTVIPRAIIEDVGEFRFGLAETIQFVTAGTIQHSDGDAVFMRGIRGPPALLDGTNEKGSYNDLANIDSIDVLKGPSAVTYPITDLTGVIIKNTKKPLPVARQAVTLTVGSGNFYRGEIDSTGPLYKKDKARLTYRLVSVYQRSDGWVAPIDHNDRFVFSPSLQYDYGNVTVRLASDYQRANPVNYAGTFLKVDANGQTVEPWSGNGRYSSFRVPWENDPYSNNRVRATGLVRFSENWEMKLYGSYNAAYLHYKQARFLVTPNQTTGLAPMWTLENDEYDLAYFGEIGVNGKYHLFGMDHVSTFGGYADDRHTKAVRYQYAGPTLSLYNPDVSNANFPDPTLSATGLAARTFLGTPNTGATNLLNAYYMHTASLLDNRIILVGGTSYIESRARTFFLTTKTWDNPPDAHDTPYRLGVVVKPLPGISVFANNSTTFAFQGNRTTSGTLVGVRHGEVVEYGVKGELLHSKLSFMLDHYDLKQTNLAIQDPANIVYYIGSGQVVDKGWEFEAQYQPTPNWSIMASWFSGDAKNLPANTRFTDSVSHTASGITKYTFSKGGPLAGFSIGADWVHSGRRWWPAANGGGYPGYDVFNGLIGYEHGAWKYSLNIRNLANRYYSIGGFDPLQWAQTGEPRAFYGSVRRSF